jgi:hypothetical protein
MEKTSSLLKIVETWADVEPAECDVWVHEHIKYNSVI